MTMSSRDYRHTARQQPRRGSGMSHRCPALGCRIWVPAHRVACSAHWFSLPEDLRRQINATYRKDPKAHLQVYLEAIRLLTHPHHEGAS